MVRGALTVEEILSRSGTPRCRSRGGRASTASCETPGTPSERRAGRHLDVGDPRGHRRSRFVDMGESPLVLRGQQAAEKDVVLEMDVFHQLTLKLRQPGVHVESTH